MRPWSHREDVGGGHELGVHDRGVAARAGRALRSKAAQADLSRTREATRERHVAKRRAAWPPGLYFAGGASRAWTRRTSTATSPSRAAEGRVHGYQRRASRLFSPAWASPSAPRGAAGSPTWPPASSAPSWAMPRSSATVPRTSRPTHTSRVDLLAQLDNSVDHVEAIRLVRERLKRIPNRHEPLHSRGGRRGEISRASATRLPRRDEVVSAGRPVRRVFRTRACLVRQV